MLVWFAGFIDGVYLSANLNKIPHGGAILASTVQA